MTVSEPIRDDGDYDSLKLVPCPDCQHGVVTIERRGTLYKRKCGSCKGHNGRVLQGYPTGARYCLIYDFTGTDA